MASLTSPFGLDRLDCALAVLFGGPILTLLFWGLSLCHRHPLILFELYTRDLVWNVARVLLITRLRLDAEFDCAWSCLVTLNWILIDLISV